MKKSEQNYAINLKTCIKLLRIMKLTYFMLMLNILAASAAGYSQTAKVSLDLKEASLKEVLTEIEAQTDLSFIYKSNLVDAEQKVDIQATDASIEQVLAFLFTERNIRCEIMDKSLIVLLPKDNISSQQNKISGVVTDVTNGEPLPGVNIMIEGTSSGVITDIDGSYTIDVPSKSTILLFSYVGYIAQRIEVGDQTVVNVTLQMDVTSLAEVVVIGYGTSKKETTTGSIASVKGDELIKSPVTNLSNALAGRLPGVITFQRSGEPGYDGATIRIRGSNTLGNNDPLIVIDGVAARAGGLERLDPNEVENISVLKDASAAIYGARAANGVILITTKKGTLNQKPRLTYSFNQGWAQPTQLPEMSDAAEYAELRNELIVNRGLRNPLSGEENIVNPPWKTDEEIQKYRDGSDPWRYPDTDWFKETFRTWSPTIMHNATLEGGTEKLKYFSTFGYKFQEGLYHKSANDYNQYNLRINLDGRLNDYVNVGVGLMGRQENRNFPSQGAGDLLWFTSRGRPTDPAYWPNGLPGPAQEYGRNPVVAVTDQTGYTNDKRYYIQSNAKVEITQPWIEGLKLTATVSYDKAMGNVKTFFKPWYLYTWDNKSYEEDGVTPKLDKALSYPNHVDPELTQNHFDQTNILLGSFLSYEKVFGDNAVTALVGVEKEQSNKNFFQGYRRYFLSSALEIFNAGGDKEKNATSGGWNDNWERARMNYFGRLSYNYKEKYLAEFVWRYDGSYMFPEDKRFGFFPGILLGYRISEEEFWKNNLSFINYFKIRGSWGQMGNDQVWFEDQLREYQYLSTYYYEWGYIINNQDVKGLRISRFPNENITWERANNMNIGIEGRTLNNRLFVEIDYFYNKRSNILWRRNASVPETAGLTLPAENIGKVDNKGFDFKADWMDVAGGLRYNVGISGGYAKNKIVFWDESPGAPEWQKSTGHPMNTNLYYEFDGVFKDWAEINDVANRPNYDGITSDASLQPGDMKFKDIDGDNKITPDDRRRFDRTNEPKWTFGLNAFAQYRNFDFTLLMQGAADSWTKVYFDSGDIGNYSQNIYDNHWSVDNPTSEHPRVHERGIYYWDPYTADYGNTYWMVNTSYLRLKNIELGYTFPRTLMGKTMFFTNLRLYVNAVNLLTISKSKDIDPEATSANATNYPLSRVLNFGLSLTF